MKSKGMQVSSGKQADRGLMRAVRALLNFRGSPEDEFDDCPDVRPMLEPYLQSHENRSLPDEHPPPRDVSGKPDRQAATNDPTDKRREPRSRGSRGWMKVETQRRPFRLLGVVLLALSATAVGASIGVTSPEREVTRLLVTAAPKDDPKPIIKTAKKAVGRAVTRVREVPEIVDRAAQVPAGQLRPCSESDPVVDFEEAITQNALQQVAAFLGAAPGTPADSTANPVLPTFHEVMGIADQVHGALETLEEALLRRLKLHVLSLLIDESEHCPEFVERVVTTAITALRPEEPKDPNRATTR